MSNIYKQIQAIQQEIKRLDRLEDSAFDDVVTIHEERLNNLIIKLTAYTIDKADNRVIPGNVCKN